MTTCSTPHISEADSFLVPCDWVCPEWLKQASTQCSAILACPSNPAADQPRTHGYFSSLYCDETQHPVTVYEQTATVFSHALKFGKCSTQLSQSISQIWSFSQLRNSLQWVRCLHRNLFVFTHKQIGKKAIQPFLWRDLGTLQARRVLFRYQISGAACHIEFSKGMAGSAVAALVEDSTPRWIKTLCVTESFCIFLPHL